MALSRPQTYFAHWRTVRPIVEHDMDINALKIAKSLPDFTANIPGIVPQFGGQCFDITVDSAYRAAQLTQSRFDYGDIRKPLKLLGARSIHMSIFVSVEFPDEDLLKLLVTYGDLKGECATPS